MIYFVKDKDVSSFTRLYTTFHKSNTFYSNNFVQNYETDKLEKCISFFCVTE